MTDQKTKEIIDHINQRDYRDVESYNDWQGRWNRKVSILMWVVLCLFGCYVLGHVILWAMRQ